MAAMQLFDRSNATALLAALDPKRVKRQRTCLPQSGRRVIQGAKSAVMTAQGRNDRISKRVLALRERSGWQKAVVALANKNARILWAVMTRGEAFDATHLSTKPNAGAPMAAPSSAPAPVPA